MGRAIHYLFSVTSPTEVNCYSLLMGSGEAIHYLCGGLSITYGEPLIFSYLFCHFFSVFFAFFPPQKLYFFSFLTPKTIQKRQ